MTVNSLPPLTIKNIKLTLKTQVKWQPIAGKRLFLDNDQVVITVYRTNQKLIHLTKIKNFDHMNKIMCRIKPVILRQTFLATGHTLPFQVVIDSVFASRNARACKKNYNMAHLVHVCSILLHDRYKISYEPELAPGCYLRSNVNLITKKLPQITLFATGSVTVMGIKSQTDFNNTQEIIDKIFAHYETSRLSRQQTANDS